MHHKRRRPRSVRAGCKLCKPWKTSGAAARKWRNWKDRRDEVTAREQAETADRHRAVHHRGETPHV